MEREQYQQIAVGAGLLAVVVAITTGRLPPLAEDHTCYRSCGFGRGRGSFRVSLHFESHHAYRCRRLIGR